MIYDLPRVRDAGYVAQQFQGLGGGLDLRDKVDAIDPGRAIDALNVEYTEQGAVYSRNGYAALTSPALAARTQNLRPFYTTSGTAQLLTGAITRVDTLNTSGGVVASSSGLIGGGNFSFARFGAPGVEYAYAGNGYNPLLRWNGAAWTATPIATVDGVGARAMPKASTMDIMAVSNRLVVGGFGTTTGGPNGATTNPSTVFFSGDNTGISPERWLTTNYIQVYPGDGEAVQRIIRWREFVFIFKETKFFVVYGESTDSAGGPIFNYRAVDAGVGCVSPRAVVAAPEGVYFLDRTGVFLTTGSQPDRVSTLIDPIFDATTSSFYLGGNLNSAQWTNAVMGTHQRRIYLAFSSGVSITNDRVLVYDPIYKWWTLHNIPMGSISTFRIGTTSELVFGYSTGSFHVGRHSSAYSSDAGAAIVSRWRSGWEDYGQPAEKVIRESKLWGNGVVFASISRDFNQAVGILDLADMSEAASSAWGGSTWGGSTWVGTKGLNPILRRRAVRGTVFSTYLYSNVNQPWSVHRLFHHLRDQRILSVKDAGSDNQ